MKSFTFIDLFAGIGGLRIGFEQACKKSGFVPSCVFTSEIKPHAVQILKQNFIGEKISDDITQIDTKDIPISTFCLQVFRARHFHLPENVWDFWTREARFFLK